MKRAKALAIDDDPIWLEQIPLILESECDVECVGTIDQGLEALSRSSVDLVLLDLNFDDDLRSGLEVFRQIHASGSGAEVIVISGETHPERLVEVCNAGITKFIPKPALPERVRAEVRRVLELREARRMAISIAATSGSPDPFLGTSDAIRNLKAQVEFVVRGGARDILIQGETGTGKEIMARHLAALLDRSGKIFPVHCGAISDGLIESELFGHVKGAFTGADRDRIGVFEAANGGVVFLDEIGEMPLHQQAKILRVIQERRVQRVGTHQERSVQFRTIAATHVNLRDAVPSGKFREDLFFRIARDVIQLPALRERGEDLPLLVSFFLKKHDRSTITFTDAAMRLLQSYNWPGNLRELDAVVRSIACRSEGGIIREKDVCAAIPEVAASMPGLTRGPMSAYAHSLLLAEKKKFEEALRYSNGFRDEAAKLLGLSRATFFRRAKELGLIRTRSTRALV
jgi:DNA-binding NtrC family response regulator